MAENSKIIYGKGVAFAGSIDIGAIGNFPLDSRLIVKSPEGLDELQTKKRVYDGMIVYCESNQTYYKARVIWDAAANITSCTWTEVVITSEEELKALIASETTAAMEFKGTVADGVLPVKTETTYTTLSKGDMYKIVTKSLTIPKDNNAENVTEAVTANPGDSIVYEGDHKWYLIPSGDDVEDTWRPQTWGGVTLDSRAPLNVTGGENVTIAATADGNVTISATDTDTHHQAKLVITDSKAGVDCKDVDIATGDMYLNLVENGEVRTAHKIEIEENSPIEITNKKATAEGEVDTLTIKSFANTKDQNGYVTAPGANNANKVWKTDENGNPDWRDDDNDNTEYTGTDKITVDGTVIKHDKLAQNASDSNKNTPVVTEAADAASTVISGVTVDEFGHVTGYETAEVNVSLDDKSIGRNDSGEIEIKGFKKDAANGNIPRVVVDAQGNRAIEWVTVKEAVSDIDDANTITRGDGTSIEEAYDGTKDTYTLSIKGVKDTATTDGKILAADGNGGVKWVDDKNTAHNHEAGTGLKITSTNKGGADGTVTYAHQDKPTTGSSAASLGNGASRTYVTDVVIDELGHVAGVKTKTETVVDTDTQTKVASGDDYIVVTPDPAEFTIGGLNTFTVSIDEDKLIELIGHSTTAAMEFKGATAVLPSDENTNDGDMYKVIGETGIEVAANKDAQGVGFTAKTGDAIVAKVIGEGEAKVVTWYYIPSANEQDTWRPVQVNGVAVGNDKTLNLKAGSLIELSESNGAVTINFNQNDLEVTRANLDDSINQSLDAADNAVEKDRLEEYITGKSWTSNSYDFPVETNHPQYPNTPIGGNYYLTEEEYLLKPNTDYVLTLTYADGSTTTHQATSTAPDEENDVILTFEVENGGLSFRSGYQNDHAFTEVWYSNPDLGGGYIELVGDYAKFVDAKMVLHCEPVYNLGIERGAQVNVIDNVGAGLILDGKTIELDMNEIHVSIFNSADTENTDIYGGPLTETFTLNCPIEVGQYYRIGYLRNMTTLEDLANVEYSMPQARVNGYGEVYMYALIEGVNYLITFNENEGTFEQLPEFSEGDTPMLMIYHLPGEGVERGAQVNKIETITSIASSHEEHDECVHCGGLKVTHDEATKTTNIEIDDSITFIFNCGGASDLI